MPRTKFSREMIIEAGLSLLKEGGWEAVTPKSVAGRLDASTMPIFSHFATMAALKEGVLDHSWDLLLAYASRSYTGDAWVDQSVGYIRFARDHGRLFSCMHYGEPEEIRNRRYRFWKRLSPSLETLPRFEGMKPEHVGWIRHLRSLLTHGIAISVSEGVATVWEDDGVVQEVMGLCSEVLCEGLARRGDRLDALSVRIPEETRKTINRVVPKGKEEE